MGEATNETAFGRVIRDAILFADLASEWRVAFPHASGFEIHATDIRSEFAKALGIEPGSIEYFAAIRSLAMLEPDAARSTEEEG